MTSKKLTYMSMLLSASLIIFIIEAQLPPLVPIPGIKLGLANVIILVGIVLLGYRDTFTILLLRIILSGIFTGNITGFIYSAAGGILAFPAMAAGYRILGQRRLWVVSVFGAVFHNIGQITAAIIITSTPAVIFYLPLLIVSGVITGTFTGLAAGFVLKRYNAFREGL